LVFVFVDTADDMPGAQVVFPCGQGHLEQRVIVP